jgi:poly(hydroxyalkanoate) depolymerase family esterase
VPVTSPTPLVLPALLASGVLLALAAPRSAAAASLQTNVSYGSNGAVMNVFVPDAVDDFPAVLVSLHYCNGQATDAASWFTPSLAEQYGFIVIAPGLPAGDGDGCWDVGSSQTLTHDGGSHSKAIAQMVAHAVTAYGADAKRAYVVGASSGAMMTNVMLGSYPDVFAAGSVLAGVPFGCWSAADGWSSDCASGTKTMSATAWGDRVRNAYPGFTGPRPRVQLWHGTSDTTLDYKNLAEEVKQWTNVLGVSETATSTQANTPKSGWTRSSYESGGAVVLEVNVGQGIAHDITGQNPFASIIEFFALAQDVTAAGGSGGMGTGGMATGGMATGGGSPAGGTGNGGAPSGGMAPDIGGMAGAIGGMSTAPPGGRSGTGGTGGTLPGGSGGTLATGGRAAGAAGSLMTPQGGRASGDGGQSAAGGPNRQDGADQPVPTDAGCGCRVGRSSERGSGLAALLVMLGAATSRLRRRRAT